MKITRNKRNYRISLSPGEFEAMTLLVCLGICDLEGDEDQRKLLSLAGRRALNGRLSSFRAMAVDVDNTKEKEASK